MKKIMIFEAGVEYKGEAFDYPASADLEDCTSTEGCYREECGRQRYSSVYNCEFDENGEFEFTIGYNLGYIAF